MNIPTLKGGQMTTIAYIIGILVLLFIIYRILGKIGLVQTKEKQRKEAEKTEAMTELRNDDYFNPLYYKGKTYKHLGEALGQKYAGDLNIAMRGAGTDEELIMVTFGKLYNKVNVSEVAAHYYLKTKGRDLQTDLLNELSEKEVVQLMNIINSLPNN